PTTTAGPDTAGGSALPAFPFPAPRLVDENLLAVNLVDVMDNHQQREEREPADREEKVRGIPQDRGEDTAQRAERVSHSIVPVRTSFPHRGKTFLREAPIR